MAGAGTTYTLELNSGLTQVLADGTNSYLYGLNRISQSNSETSGTFLGDALGSVRQARILRPRAKGEWGKWTLKLRSS